jgi:hypothetical protein
MMAHEYACFSGTIKSVSLGTGQTSQKLVNERERVGRGTV